MARGSTRGSTGGAAARARQPTGDAVMGKQADGRRILPTVDFIEQPPERDVQAFIEAQTLSATHFFQGLTRLTGMVGATVLEPPPVYLPDQLAGTVQGPGGEPLGGVMVTLSPPATVNKVRWQDVTAITRLDGGWTLRAPARKIALEPGSELELSFRGADGVETAHTALADIVPSGYWGETKLRRALRPLPTSVLAQLGSLLGWTAEEPVGTPATTGPDRATPVIKLGEAGCEINFRTDLSDQRHPYGVLFRLVEPRPSILTRTFLLDTGGIGGVGGMAVAARNLAWAGIGGLRQSFADRVPIDQPISVDGFRDKIVGLNANGVIGAEETVPMAGTLGLGYVLRLAQQWTPQGLSLGDLVYSLPLAPGEQQKIAVYEQRQTLATSEFERLDEEQQEAARQTEDSSTSAVFQSAFHESVVGTSSFSTRASSSSWGAAGGIGFALGPIVIGGGAAGGSGKSAASGESRQTLDGNRNYASAASEQMHAATTRQSAARRSAQRTAIRMSVATDETVATTKIITNNNRLHALTIQYWQVNRHFSVTSAVQGVTLVCFVPLEVVRFLPAGQPLALAENSLANRDDLLRRYRGLHKHMDVLERWVPGRYREGLRILADVIANPRYRLDLDGIAEETLDFSLSGTFLPFEAVYVSLLMRRGMRLGPVKMTGHVAPLPDRVQDPANAYSTRAELLKGLHDRRNSDAPATLNARILLPDTVGPQDIAGFELSRVFRTLRYPLAPQKDDPNYALLEKAVQNGDAGANIISALGPWFFRQTFQSVTNGVTLNPAELETELGGPTVSGFVAALTGVGSIAAENLGGTVELPSSPFPISARDLDPVLRFRDVLAIERTLQHVVRNTVQYSKYTWMSLTPEERAIMLEGFTIGVPAGGAEDASQTVPLLNCVANQVLGYYGNAMILPFSIPPSIGSAMSFGEGEEGRPLTTGVIQDALTSFHRQGFSPPVSQVALPTRGVLAEAVLGCCPSGEKIDLTRFWNWQDSPIPQAPDVQPVSVGAGQPLAGATAPDTLSKLPTLITNVSTGSPGNSGAEVLKALIEAGKDAKDFSDITGADKLAELTGKTLDTAEKARGDALKSATQMASEALKAVPDVMKAKQGAEDAKDKKATDAEDKKAAEKTKTADAKAATVKAAVEKLKTSAADYMGVADAQVDQAHADAKAKAVVASLTGNEPIPDDQAQTLFTAYDKKEGGNRTKGSLAYLRALGIFPNH